MNISPRSPVYTMKGGDALMGNTAEEYFVQGYIRNSLRQRFVVAKSARQACKLFCLEFGLNEAEDVPYLEATNVLSQYDYYAAVNNGYLE